MLLAALGPPLAAEPVTLNGITFSDEFGGFRLVGGRGSGTLADPFVIIERITGEEPAVLAIRGLTRAFGNPTRSNHFVGFAMTKVVINASGEAWRNFGFDLQSRLGEDSGYFDGLSFGQEEAAIRPVTSDLYGDAVIVDEPIDGMMFTDGVVRPGERAVFRFVITDNAPRPEFYLVQRRHKPVAMR